MSSWRQRRKFTYLASVVSALVLIMGVPLYLYFYKAPSCVDTKQNQDEEGVDCGGPCISVCSFSAVDPITRWARAFPISPGNYNAVAFVENPNTNAQVSRIAYSFKFYDDKNLLLSERRGVTFIPAKSSFPVFETNINTGARIIKKTFFEFTEMPNWQKSTHDMPILTISSKNLTNEEVAPKLSSVISNQGLLPIKNITVVAILYDKEDNAVASSVTYIESVAKESTNEAIFTWPRPFSVPIARIEIYPKISSFR